MHISDRCRRLKGIYKIYETFIGDIDDMDCVCVKGCATCCTCNVVGTTLEGLLIYEFLTSQNKNGDQLFDRLYQNAPADRYQPVVTTNELVAICSRGEALPVEHNDPAAGRCSFLSGHDYDCAVYDVRPFGCRALVSTQDCRSNTEDKSFLISWLG